MTIGAGLAIGLGFCVAIARMAAAALHTASVVCVTQIGQTMSVFFQCFLKENLLESLQKKEMFSSTWCPGGRDVARIIIIIILRGHDVQNVVDALRRWSRIRLLRIKLLRIRLLRIRLLMLSRRHSAPTLVEEPTSCLRNHWCCRV